MAKGKSYNWVALLVLGAFFVAGVIAPNTDAFAATNYAQQRVLPDLTSTQLEVSRELIGSLYTDTITLTVQNQGKTDAGAFIIEIKDTTYNKVLANFEVSGLAAGSTKKYETYYRNAPLRYWIQAIVDRDNTVKELDEYDNTVIRMIP